MPQERLQKFMAHAGTASRRKCEELILSGQVEVNGQVITELGFKVDTLVDEIKVAGSLIEKPEDKVYFLLNKPVGVLSSASDDRGRKTVTELIKDTGARLYPVGRLDFDTEGLLLLTNDGELTNLLIHPRYKVDKTYLAEVVGQLKEQDIEQLRVGIELEDGLTAPAKVKTYGARKGNGLVEITIHEGRNRQVRRMFEKIGHPVIHLKRVRFGILELGRLIPGQYRKLTAREVNDLYKLVGVPRT